MPTPYAEVMVPSYPSTCAHCYDDEGEREMPKVNETCMKSN
jgi:hypothetical protein